MRKQHNSDNVKGLNVEVRNGDFNGALRRFKKKVQEAGIIQEVRARGEFIKPSEVRKRAKAAGIARWKKKLRTSELNTPTGKQNRKY
jgi:small subunit ribosomal protein S21|tara:strand:- start:141 stop:401 length:261 start_codon:yes stop_codon:yes gene_type:complete